MKLSGGVAQQAAMTSATTGKPSNFEMPAASLTGFAPNYENYSNTREDFSKNNSSSNKSKLGSSGKSCSQKRKCAKHGNCPHYNGKGPTCNTKYAPETQNGGDCEKDSVQKYRCEYKWYDSPSCQINFDKPCN
jgi:hypothetical protein